MSLNYGSTATLSKVEVSNLQGQMGGAIHVTQGSTLTAIDCDFIENESSVFGGIIFIENSEPATFSKLTMTGNLGGPGIKLNGGSMSIAISYIGSSGYQALQVNLGRVTLTQNTIRNAGNYNELGGGLYCDCFDSTFI